MPVGCLGGGQAAGGLGEAENTPEMDVIVTSSVLNTADQFAFMQQTLLMQIFRVNPPTNVTSGSSASSTSSRSSAGLNSCPTCVPFSDSCCQTENGAQIFQEFLEANLHCSVWDQKLSDALSSLR